jgi:hypothetical protein
MADITLRSAMTLSDVGTIIGAYLLVATTIAVLVVLLHEAARSGR